MDDDDFLAAVEADNANTPVEEPTPAPVTAETSLQEEINARRDKGLEAPQEPVQPAPAETALSEPATPTEPPVIPEAPKQPEPGYVPIAALLDEREKAQKAAAELAQLRASQAPPQFEVPDRYEDPEGYEAYQETRLQQALINQTLNTSERFARKEHGTETVEAAKAWAQQRFQTDPLYQQQILRDVDPYERVVTDYRREQLFSKVTDPSEFDAFLAWKAAQNQLQQAPQSAPTNQSPPIPTRSLASAPSAGNILTEPIQSDEEVFAETFARK